MKQNLLPLHYSERYRLLNDLEYRTDPCGDDTQKYLLLILHHKYCRRINGWTIGLVLVLPRF